jgi:dTDP-4-dehydrorhamnose 3,5-epimerase
MRFQPLPIQGVVQVDVEAAADARGSFARLHCEREFEAQGLAPRMVQSSVSHSRQRGTLRGMHFQWPPSQEGKLVRCIRGSIHDVVIDLRPDSATFAQHLALQLTAAGRCAVFIPPGLAHGFQTLDDDVEVLYQMTDSYDPALAAGVRWNDPAFGIAWPLPVTAIHERDAGYADFNAVRFADEYGARSSRSD